jgi:two-component system, sensor histidine kinase
MMASEERILSMRKHVLLVEDEPSHQELIQTALELVGYTVTLAHNGLEAFEKLATETPCAIVLDLWMPEMSGYTFLETWRERNTNAAIPIVVLTADAMATRKLAQEHHTILVKPFNMAQLLNILANYCP